MDKVLLGDSWVDIEREFRATRPDSPGYVLEHFVTQFDFFDWVFGLTSAGFMFQQ